ncbi:hypothetical protein KC644_03495 [Candidatus Berkelbacteria bacterium]|nr:hypothetical protein [Candidatus Berkelbacteria bacterium]
MAILIDGLGCLSNGGRAMKLSLKRRYEFSDQETRYLRHRRYILTYSGGELVSGRFQYTGLFPGKPGITETSCFLPLRGEKPEIPVIGVKLAWFLSKDGSLIFESSYLNYNRPIFDYRPIKANFPSLEKVVEFLLPYRQEIRPFPVIPG